jgi:hypothetical protein
MTTTHPLGDLADLEKRDTMDSCRSNSSSLRERSEDNIGLEHTKSEDATFAPIVAPEDQRDLQMKKERSNLSRTRSLERSWSLNDGVSLGGNGYEEEAGEAAGQEVPENDAGYAVGWDANDPMNPRNMSKARRWLIVIIVSLGSLCV